MAPELEAHQAKENEFVRIRRVRMPILSESRSEHPISDDSNALCFRHFRTNGIFLHYAVEQAIFGL